MTTLLIVDDEITNRMILEETLGAHYGVHLVEDGEQALAWLKEGNQTDLILSDVIMPKMDGFELCRRLKADGTIQDIPLLFLTSLSSVADEEKGLLLGAEDFIHKPISPPIVLARVRNHLELAQARTRLRERNIDLELLVLERTQEIVRRSEEALAAQSATITAFCALAEARDDDTGNHIRRTQHYVKALADQLRTHPRFSADLDTQTIDLLFRSAPLHDVGKVAIPDAVLNKPGKLDPDEWKLMQRHAEFGRDAIVLAEGELGSSSESFLRYAREIAYSHHEKWDGTGYPQGLSGEAIPLSARLMAVADVYDALISKRVYKPAFSHEKAMAIIVEGRGSHFDPDMVDALLAIPDAFRAIAQRFNDMPNLHETHSPSPSQPPP
ncbi:MAG: response regulator, partial [Rhodocyclaceae bacterium]|nr:response regulator [Rhodocyclaceae bacterium]